MAMAPDGDSSANDYFIDCRLSTGNIRCFNTGVNLPHGATMTRLSVWYSSGGNSNPLVQLLRHTLADGSFNLIVSGSIVDVSGTRKQKNFAIADTPVAKANNAQYAYGLGVCLGSDTKFHGARLTYTYTHAGD
jgi:hypothetical protein